MYSVNIQYMYIVHVQALRYRIDHIYQKEGKTQARPRQLSFPYFSTSSRERVITGLYMYIPALEVSQCIERHTIR